MASDINKRINQLRARRIGADRLTLLDESARREIMAKSLYGAESWEKQAANRPNTRYIVSDRKDNKHLFIKMLKCFLRSEEVYVIAIC